MALSLEIQRDLVLTTNPSFDEEFITKKDNGDQFRRRYGFIRVTLPLWVLKKVSL